MKIRRELAVAIGAAVLIVSGLTAASVAYAANDDGCVAIGQVTKAIGPDGGTAVGDERRVTEDGPRCVPAVPAIPASR
jgi:hypothetical protein